MVALVGAGIGDLFSPYVAGGMRRQQLQRQAGTIHGCGKVLKAAFHHDLETGIGQAAV